jgi:hypothetical protein
LKLGDDSSIGLSVSSIPSLSVCCGVKNSQQNEKKN